MFKLLPLLAAVAVLQASQVRRADSLYLSGRVGQAETELLRLLEDGRHSRDAVLYRLVGLYHGTGREDDCLLLLDGLQDATGEVLIGWKVSVLHLAGRIDDALALVPHDNVLLRAWLLRHSGNAPPSGAMPAPADLAERAVRALECPAGRMTKGQVEQTVLDAAYLPSLAYRMIDELELSMGSEGPWWDSMAADLAAVHEGPKMQLLLARRDSHLAAGSEETWRGRLETDSRVSAMAALVLLERAPAARERSWMIMDLLVEGGRASIAESIAISSRDAHFETGVAMALLRNRGMNRDLLALCESVSPDMPDTLRARAALFRARAQRALQKPPSEYYGSYLDFARGFPWHPTASEAAYLAARYYDSAGSWPEAADAYLVCLRAGGYGGAIAYWRGGFCHYMCGRGAVGDSIWAEGIERYPFSAWCDEMLFWRARYAGRKGDRRLEETLLAETADRHPWEFYGLLAAERLGVGTPEFPMPEVHLTSDPVTAEALRMMSRGYGAMASEMLYGSAQSDEGRRAAALALMGQNRRSLELLRSLDTRLRRENLGILPDSLLRFYFPAPYREITELTVSGTHIPAELLIGLMRQESYFDRFARSWVGASGLIQLMPGTAGDIARWYGLPALSGADFFDPASSILYGSLYLGRQLSSFDGSTVLALAAYNAGPGNASRWNGSFPLEEEDPELFIERIPFVETRGYVKHVLANAWIYGRILHGRS